MAGSTTPRRLRWTLVVLAVAAVVLVGFTGYQALEAKTSLDLVARDFTTLKGQLTSGDQTGAEQTLARAQAHAGKARASTHGPGWWLSSKIPGVGRNVVAVRTVADVVDNLSSKVLPDVVRATAALEPQNLRPARGRVDLAPITAVAPSVVRADTRLAAQAGRVQRIDAGQLVSQVARPVRLLQDRLTEASDLADRTSRAVRLLPPMLGAHGRRTYLLFFQNNAEVRATGGLPGSFAVVTADHGKVSLGRQGPEGLIGRFTRPPTPLTAEETALFGANPGVYPQDTNFTPDFPRTAELMRTMWNVRHPADKVDGVLSTDPVALSYLLRGTGPVALPGGRKLTAGSAVPLLLSQVYATFPDPNRQNDFFEGVAKSVFRAVSSGQGQPRSVLVNLSSAASQRRILLWSDRPREQALIAPTSLGGALPKRPSPAPQVGVYLNDTGGAKLDYYLDYHVDVTSTRCQAGRQYLSVAVHMRSSVPAAPSRLPSDVAGNLNGPTGVIGTTYYVYAPLGGYFDDPGQNDNVKMHDGRPVLALFTQLKPGERQSFTYRMVTGKHQTARTDLQVTPGVHTDGVGTVGAPAC